MCQKRRGRGSGEHPQLTYKCTTGRYNPFVEPSITPYHHGHCSEEARVKIGHFSPCLGIAPSLITILIDHCEEEQEHNWSTQTSHGDSGQCGQHTIRAQSIDQSSYLPSQRNTPPDPGTASCVSSGQVSCRKARVKRRFTCPAAVSTSQPRGQVSANVYACTPGVARRKGTAYERPKFPVVFCSQSLQFVKVSCW